MCTKPTVVFKPPLKKERNNQKEKKGRKEQKKKIASVLESETMQSYFSLI